MLKAILLVIAAAILAIVVYASTRPDTFKVERSVEISASPAQVAAWINDFTRWSAWSPWEKLDPAMQKRFAGPTAGVGAVYEWEGNKKVGKGRMTILESSSERIVIQLDFVQPFEAHNTTVFALLAQGQGTRVVWTMTGTNSLPSKIMQLWMSMDAMVGGDFERGLANLKTQIEKPASNIG